MHQSTRVSYCTTRQSTTHEQLGRLQKRYHRICTTQLKTFLYIITSCSTTAKGTTISRRYIDTALGCRIKTQHNGYRQRQIKTFTYARIDHKIADRTAESTILDVTSRLLNPNNNRQPHINNNNRYIRK